MQIKLPRKLVCGFQLWISVILVIFALIFSLTAPIITLSTDGSFGRDVVDFIEDELDLNLGDYSLGEEGLDITTPKLIGSITLLIDIINAIDDDKAQAELQEYISTPEGKEDLVTVAGLAVVFMNTFDFDNMPSEPSFDLIFDMSITMIALLFVVVMTFVIPIMLIVAAIAVVIKALRNIKTPEDASGMVANKLTPMLSMTLTVMLFQCVINEGVMEAGSGLTTIFILAIVSVAVNFIATRLREYPSAQFRYINIVQPVAILSIVGFLVFFFNLLETRITVSYIKGFMPFAVAGEEYAHLAMMGVYIILALGCVGYLDKAARRLCCSVKPEGPKGIVGLFIKGKVSDNNIVHAVMNLLVYILPAVVIAMDGFEFYTEETEGAFSGMLVGAIIMLVAEIAAMVLRTIFCKDLSTREAEELLTGVALTSEEKIAEAKKTLAEAEAIAGLESSRATITDLD